MRKLVVSTFITLDGVMQAPGGPEEDPTGGFTYGGWSFNYWDNMMGQVMGESMAKSSELLLGRRTYEIFAAHWPYIKDDPVADKLNSVKEQNGPEIQVLGSGNLIQTLLKQDLIDESSLPMNPPENSRPDRLLLIIRMKRKLKDANGLPMRAKRRKNKQE